MPERFELQVAGGIARLRMVRAEGRNAIDPLWVAELGQALTAVEADGSARALLICADGPAFSVGGDMGHFLAEADRMADELSDMIGGFPPAPGRPGAPPPPRGCARNRARGGGGGRPPPGGRPPR